MFRDSEATVLCWAMGITQHRNAVATIKEIVNVALLQGNIGKPGAGLCPVRGHSNVQGDRTMGIWERPKPAFLDALRDEFGFEPPREHGFDTVEAVQALARRAGAGVLRDGRQLRLGGLRHRRHRGGDAPRRPHRARLDQAEPLARRHGPRGADPPGARPQRTRPHRRPRAAGDRRGLDVRGARLEGAARAGVEAPAVRGRHRLLARRGDARRTTHGLPWADFRADYGAIRQRIARVVPGCAAYDEKVDQPGGFVLPHPPRDAREFPTDAGQAVFSASPIDVLEVPEGRLLLQTLRSHDQFNTTIYGLDDRYRGVKNGRRVVFVHPDDIAHLGCARRRPRRPGQRVARRVRAGRDRLPDRVLRPAARLRRGVLPGDQPAGPARLQGRGQQHPDLEVGRSSGWSGRRAGAPASSASAVATTRPGTSGQTDPVQQS